MTTNVGGLDQNSRRALFGLSSVDGVTPVNVWVDPTLHALLVAVSMVVSNINIETPTGLINGTNVTYTTTKTINAVLGFFINGQFLHPTTATSSGTATDYSYTSGAGMTVTMSTALPANLAGTGFTIIYT